MTHVADEIGYFSKVLESLAKPLFTINLNSVTGGPGFLTLGYISASYPSSTIKHVNVVRDSPYWDVNAAEWGFQAEGTDQREVFPIQPEQSQTSLDTGTSVLVLPSTIIEKYLSQLGDEGTAWNRIPKTSGDIYSFDCDKKLPTLFYHIHQYTAEITGQSLRNKEMENNTPGGTRCKKSNFTLSVTLRYPFAPTNQLR